MIMAAGMAQLAERVKLGQEATSGSPVPVLARKAVGIPATAGSMVK